jgi:hypothetical protein
VGTVGSIQLAARRDLEIFPNPASNAIRQWTLSGWQPEEMGQALNIKLRNINGQIIEVQQDQIRERVLLSVERELPAGFYFVEARSAGQVYIGRIVVQ